MNLGTQVAEGNLVNFRKARATEKYSQAASKIFRE